MSSAPPLPIRRKTLFLRLAIVLVLLASGVLLVKLTPLGDFLTEEKVIGLFEELRQHWWTPLLLILGYCVFAPLGLPASPLLVAGGVVFGIAVGSAYNLVGLIAGAMCGYYVARMLGRDAVAQLAGPRLRRAEKIFQRRGFWTLVHTRFLPIPFSVISYGAALAGVKPWPFLTASIVGLLPATIVHTYFASSIVLAAIRGERPVMLFAGYLVALLVLNLIASWPQLRERAQRKKRYEDILERRRGRKISP